jgi:hypothetical protein
MFCSFQCLLEKHTQHAGGILREIWEWDRKKSINFYCRYARLHSQFSITQTSLIPLVIFEADWLDGKKQEKMKKNISRAHFTISISFPTTILTAHISRSWFMQANNLVLLRVTNHQTNWTYLLRASDTWLARNQF